MVPLEEDSHTTEDWNQAVRERLPSTHDTAGDRASVPLSLLPPLLLEIILPPAYPTYVPPQIVALHATHGWLGRRVAPLRQLLLEMWQAGEGVLYTWIEWIRSGDFLEAL